MRTAKSEGMTSAPKDGPSSRIQLTSDDGGENSDGIEEELKLGGEAEKLPEARRGNKVGLALQTVRSRGEREPERSSLEAGGRALLDVTG